MIADKKGTFASKILTNSLPPSPYFKVYQKNVKKDTFSKDTSQVVNRLLKEPMSTLLISSQYIPSTIEYSQCKVGIKTFPL